MASEEPRERTHAIPEDGFVAERVNVAVLRVLDDRHQLAALIREVLVVDDFVVDEGDAGDVVGELQQDVEVRQDEGNRRQILVLRDVTRGFVVVGRLGIRQRLLAGDEVGRDLIHIAEEDSGLSQPAEGLREFVFV